MYKKLLLVGKLKEIRANQLWNSIVQLEGAVFVMSSPVAIVFDFPDAQSATNAYSLLKELGYDPDMHDADTLHIHVVNEDLTSALEIAQANGGTLVEQSQIQEELLASTAYSLDSIHIPAHLVNEDLIAEEEEEDLLPEIEDLSAFSGF